MSSTQGGDNANSEEQQGQADLAHSGAVIDKAIEHLLEQDVDPLAVASALLAGSLGLLTQTVGEDATVQVLNSAVTSVKNGDLRTAKTEDGEDAGDTKDDPGKAVSKSPLKSSLSVADDEEDD